MLNPLENAQAPIEAPRQPAQLPLPRAEPKDNPPAHSLDVFTQTLPIGYSTSPQLLPNIEHLVIVAVFWY